LVGALGGAIAGSINPTPGGIGAAAGIAAAANLAGKSIASDNVSVGQIIAASVIGGVAAGVGIGAASPLAGALAAGAISIFGDIINSLAGSNALNKAISCPR